MPIKNKNQKNSKVLETHLTTKLPERTTGGFEINSTVPSYVGS